HLRWHHTTRLIPFPATLPGRACWDDAAITPSCHIHTGPLPLRHSPRFAEWSRSMRAFMSSGPCHGFSDEFISQAGVQGMFNLAQGSNHLTEVEEGGNCKGCGYCLSVLAFKVSAHIVADKEGAATGNVGEATLKVQFYKQPLHKVAPSDVAQPSVVELAWFNAAGTN
ncbi:hypothetical protein KUCAC02_021861, partial [Chaenocephalus aceratus]